MVIIFNFNSIKVQLEPLILERLIALASFQFHKGTIRTDIGNYADDLICISIP